MSASEPQRAEQGKAVAALAETPGFIDIYPDDYPNLTAFHEACDEALTKLVGDDLVTFGAASVTREYRHADKCVRISRVWLKGK